MATSDNNTCTAMLSYYIPGHACRSTWIYIGIAVKFYFITNTHTGVKTSGIGSYIVIVSNFTHITKTIVLLLLRVAISLPQAHTS